MPPETETEWAAHSSKVAELLSCARLIEEAVNEPCLSSFSVCTAAMFNTCPGHEGKEGHTPKPEEREDQHCAGSREDLRVESWYVKLHHELGRALIAGLCRSNQTGAGPSGVERGDHRENGAKGGENGTVGHKPGA